VTYVKWVANADRHNDWTSELLLADGTRLVKMGVPVDLKAEVRKSLEEEGRVFEDSSKEEFETHQESFQVVQPLGHDVRGTAPVFVERGPRFNRGASRSRRSVRPTRKPPSPLPRLPARGGSNS
jgi:hypothetical protein